jgi:hypothetical protein
MRLKERWTVSQPNSGCQRIGAIIAGGGVVWARRYLTSRSGALRREALPPALPATPHPRRSESEAFRNSRRRGPTTRGGSVSSSFLLTSASVGPRSFGKVRSEPRRALLSSQRIIGMVRFHLRTQRRKTHQPAFADLLPDEGIAVWP